MQLLLVSQAVGSALASEHYVKVLQVPLTLSVAELGVNAQTTLFVPSNPPPLHASKVLYVEQAAFGIQFFVLETHSLPGITLLQAELLIPLSISSHYFNLHDFAPVV